MTREAATESEQRLRFLLENVRDSIIITDVDGRIVEWNKGAERIFGYRAEEMLGRTPADLYVAQPDEAQARLSGDLASIEQGTAFRGEWEGKRKDGSAVCVEVRTTQLLDANGAPRGFIGIGTDITERKRADQASRAKDEFLAMLGHELRNPLSPIVTALHLLKLKTPTPGRELVILERQVQHLVRLVDDLLDISRITRGKVELKKQPIELDEPALRAIEMAGPLLEQYHHRLEVDVAKTGLRLHADSARIAQVIANLLTNAARYTKPGGTITLTAARENDELVLSVADTGIGMSAELLPRVFDLFVQGHRAADRAEGGLGLGLALVQSLVKMHGGVVAAASEGPGKGSRFTVRLPALDPAESAPGSEQRPSRISLTSALRRILVVDDNVDAAELLAEVLRGVGHEVFLAFDGPSGLASAEANHPTIAVLDIGLPVMDGYELARRIHELPGPPRLIAMTGYGLAMDRERSREAGFSAHIVKPVSVDELLDEIDRV